jgi:hypothetical protein
MKKLLIVSPNFPPADAPDAHRVRMNASTYRSAGWEPTVLCVHHGDTGRTVDLRLLQTLPEGLRVEGVQADDTTWARRLGISAIGLRAYRSLGAAGDELLSNGRFDLVFISTTAFPLMALGRRWLRSFGVPFVLDMQDPWYTSPPESIALQRPGARHAAMRRVHRFLEQGTMPEAGGIISVSPRYVEALRQRYPQLRERPSEVVPFGFSRNDLAVARAVGRPWPALAEARGRGRIVAFSAGRVNDSMASSLETLLKVLQQRTAGGTAMFGRLSLMFLGTEYGASPGVGRIATLAARMGLADRVTEQASRLPLLDAFRSLYDAEVLIVLGSRDLAYQPSRFYQCVSIGKPSSSWPHAKAYSRASARNFPTSLSCRASLRKRNSNPSNVRLGPRWRGLRPTRRKSNAPSLPTSRRSSVRRRLHCSIVWFGSMRREAWVPEPNADERRLLCIMPSIPLGGMERAVLRVVKALMTQGFATHFVLDGVWGREVQAAVSEAGASWSGVPFVASTSRPRTWLEARLAVRSLLRSPGELLRESRTFRPRQLLATGLNNAFMGRRIARAEGRAKRLSGCQSSLALRVRG